MKKSNPWADLALAIQFLTALLAWLSLTGSLRADGELARLDARDAGVVMKHGDGPNQCDYLGARDVWVWEAAALTTCTTTGRDQGVG